MDSLIQKFDAVQDDDLMVSVGCGVAYQRDIKARSVSYDDAYLAKVDGYENGEIARRVNYGRCLMLSRHLRKGAALLDVGAGSGAFVRAAADAGFVARGYDVIPSAAGRLRRAGCYSDAPELYDALTMWDSIEHMEDPALWLTKIRRGAYLFASIPVFSDIRKVRESKHYRPGEHLYYWTDGGFCAWVSHYGFRLLERSPHETEAGREKIGAFAFRRDLPDSMTN